MDKGVEKILTKESLERELFDIEFEEAKGYITMPQALISLESCQIQHIIYHFKLKEDLRRQIKELE